jgi:hypothetical protein
MRMLIANRVIWIISPCSQWFRHKTVTARMKEERA